ncbi:hypothetical protein LCGC14_0475040 [marine sediment metagenome]|uniref:Uncharacterized protein n=1 Tax=marine sediment metagenome TaxID=412755 RepID=A0A0F9UXS2_9ZZZZ
MLILDTAGDTIQAEASAASSITVSCYGIETTSGTDNYKRLGVAQLTGSGTQDTIYTVPASTVTICSVIVIANTSGSSRTVKLWDVENAGSPADANAILGTVTIAANSSIIWNKGNITEIPNAAGGGGADEKVGIDSGATAGYLGAASGDGVLRTGVGLSYADGGNFITLTADVGIANDKIMQVDDADAADNDYAKFTASGLEGRSAAEVLSDLSASATSAFNFNGQDLINGGVLFLTEQANAEADVPGKGQLWVKTGAPNTLYFTDEDGTDTQLGVGGGTGFGRPLVFTPQKNEPPSANFATLDTRNLHPVLDFDATTNESAVFSSVLPAGYAGGGLTVYIHYAMTSAVANTIDWDVSFERIGDQVLDIDGDSFAAVNSVDNTTVPGTTGLVDVVSIAFTDGADMDSIAAGESFRIKITRDAASDDAAGDAELLRLVVKET